MEYFEKIQRYSVINFNLSQFPGKDMEKIRVSVNVLIDDSSSLTELNLLTEKIT